MKRISLLALCLTLLLSFGTIAFAEEYDYSDKERESLIFDEADVLSDNEELELLELLEKASTEKECELAYITVTSFNGLSPEEFADDYYNDKQFGYKTTNDALILIVNTVERRYTFYGFNFGNDVMSYKDNESNLRADVEKVLSTNDYFGACEAYIESTKEAIDNYDNRSSERDFFSLKWIIAALVVGVISGFIYTGILKSKMNTVRSNATANDYITPGTLQITQQRDIYMYSNVTKTPKPQQKSSGGSGGGRGISSSGGRASSGKF